jgi:hypothetical protein
MLIQYTSYLYLYFPVSCPLLSLTLLLILLYDLYLTLYGHYYIRDEK